MRLAVDVLLERCMFTQVYTAPFPEDSAEGHFFVYDAERQATTSI